MAKRIIRLTESELKHLVFESASRLLREDIENDYYDDEWGDEEDDVVKELGSEDDGEYIPFGEDEIDDSTNPDRYIGSSPELNQPSYYDGIERDRIIAQLIDRERERKLRRKK